MMESKKSKKTRPSQKERVKSAPLIPQSLQQQPSQSQTSTKRGSHTLEPSAAALSPPSSPINRKSTYVGNRSSAQSHIEGSGGVNEVVVAVLGAAKVGKSTFIHLALDLKKAVSSPISSKKVSLEGLISMVRLIEVDVEDVEVANESLLWPDTVGLEAIPSIDGVLVMYSVLDPSSISPLPPLLNALSNDRVPTLVVASNCDHSPKSWQIDHGKVERLCNIFEGVDCFQTSISVSETHKRCVSIILRNVMLERNGDSCKSRQNLTSRPPPATNPQPTSPQRKTQPVEHENRRGCVSSEVSGAVSGSATSRNSDSLLSPGSSGRNGDLVDEDFQEAKQWLSLLIDEDSSSEASNIFEHSESEDEPESHTDVTEQQTPSRSEGKTSLQGSKHLETGDAIPGEDAGHDLARVESITQIELFPKKGEDEEDKETGMTFDNLVDRLLSQPMSKSDSKFTAIFLCFYRKFAAPSELLLALVQRFEDMNAFDRPELTRLNSQLRHLTILKEWVSDYPGDFAHSLTWRIITSFVQGLAGSSVFAVAHKEIGMHLDLISEDDDTEWACSDRSRSRASTMESFLTMSSTQSDPSTVTAESSTDNILEEPPSLEKVSTRRSTRISSTPSTGSGTEKSTNPSTISLQTSLHIAENAQRQAQLLTPVPRILFDKVRWHQMMEIPEEQIAKELTRIDWIMYSSIRPRDLVRHISLPADQKEKCRSLEHVNRMINQFNHVAFWVANLILLQDKPKHRAKALEKFMGVAWKLRHLNNYNSLGAVIAGINGTAVHRLSQTRELVSPEAQKQFMRLEILMGTQKSHFAYRLAWENTSTARIPFLPLHRRDLVMTEEANSTFLAGSDGELINWKKFEIMGQVVIDIRKSQQLPYPPLIRHEEVQRLVLDGTFPKDDDELYERSCQLERPRAGENPRKKFNWFQR